MCEANNRERDRFISELANITDKYIVKVARIRFDLVLKLRDGYNDSISMDTEELVIMAESEINEATEAMNKETALLLLQHFLY